MTVSTRYSSGAPPPALPPRAHAAIGALRLSNWLSRTLGRGSGTVAGGRVGLAIDPGLLGTLSAGRRVALVSGTNGKTTTTRMLVAALSGPSSGAVASNDTGANMPAGHLSALVASPDAPAAVLEVDEGYLGRLIEETRPRVVVLLNLSRDQLDRIAEVRMLVDRWRTALGGQPRPDLHGGVDPAPTVVVANADDPMVVWAASAAPVVHWVGAGQVWRNDAVGCPSCGGVIDFGPDGAWACARCGLERPERRAWVEGSVLVTAGGDRLSMEIGLPGQFNRANAAMAAVAATEMGDDVAPAPSLAEALHALSVVDQVAGRFSSTVRNGRPVRLLLAKNPAGWTAIFDLLDETAPEGGPVVLSVNARVADGLDTSWLWDVPFERLAGRPVIATGDRRLDLAVRLRYAEVGCTVVGDPLVALDVATSDGGRRGRGGQRGCRLPRQLHRLRRCAGPAVTASGPRSALCIVVVYPDLLGTYGDGGNGLILARRASWRGIDVDLVQADSSQPVPTGDIYCLGGGEDGPQVRASTGLVADGTLLRAVDRGAVVLGVCAGYQLLGRSFPDSVGRPHPGLGLLDVTTAKGTGRRAVGELVAEPTAAAPRLADGSPMPTLTGFENHGGVTTVGSGARPVGRVVAGIGNGDGDGTEGAWSGRVFGCYLHGPLLARNTALADLLLGWAVSPSGAGPLEPLEDDEERALRGERLGAVGSTSRSRWHRRPAVKRA